MRLFRLSAVLIAAACLQAPMAADAQDGANTRGFVDQIAFARTDDDALARWDSRICVGAVGLDPSVAQRLVDRISARAQSVGLRAGEPGCRANVMVIYAPDSDALTRQIVDQRRDLLGFYAEDGRVTAGRDAMDEFANTPRAIRWWHISSTGVGSLRPDAARTRQSSGTTAAIAASGSGSSSGTMATAVGSAQDLEGADAVRVSGTRARAEVRNELTYALIVVDARRVANVSSDAWMDYAAFAVLAQLDPNARTSDYPTILNLFSSPASAPTALTAWDVGYLEALYRARNEQSSRQVASIARRLSDSVPAQ